MGLSMTNQNFICDEIKCRLKAWNSCYSVQTNLPSRLLSTFITATDVTDATLEASGY